MLGTLLADGGPPPSSAGWPDLILVLVIAALILFRVSVAVRRHRRPADRYTNSR